MEQFKKDEWIVRKWKDDEGGEKDFAKVKLSVVEEGSETLIISQFYRVLNGKISYAETEVGFVKRDFDLRLSIQFKSASSIEISYIKKLIGDMEEKKKRVKKILQTVNK
jgi:hypothetical protein